ncbi:NUDIX domain-containing protein [Streptomyces sp. NPDC048638]|uniref:NUDIX domain-containing protein n=1 Tax=Streptomyces sp. NPDC048638 TaxID=3365580 RepID=UPI003716B7FE
MTPQASSSTGTTTPPPNSPTSPPPTSRKRAHAPASGRLRGRRPHQRRPGGRSVLPQRRTRGDFPSRWPARSGETPEGCARRELKEEAGVEATRWQHLGTYTITLGSNARLSLFLASHLTLGPQELNDTEEDFKLSWCPMNEAIQAAQDSRLHLPGGPLALLLADRTQPKGVPEC